MNKSVLLVSLIILISLIVIFNYLSFTGNVITYISGKYLKNQIIETDRGFDVSRYGVITLVNGSKGSYSDYCINNSGVLYETAISKIFFSKYYRIYMRSYTCPYGCINGYCKSKGK